jgi:hypothetical protein
LVRSVYRFGVLADASGLSLPRTSSALVRWKIPLVIAMGGRWDRWALFAYASSTF